MKYFFQNNLSRIANLKNLNKAKFKIQNRISGLSVVILNLDKPEFILPLVAILKQTKTEFMKANLFFEILIGDTGSTNPSVLDVYKDPDLKIISGLKYHFSKNNNQVAFESSSASFILFMNNDILFKDPLFLLNFYREASTRANSGIFGHVLLFENLTIQHRGIEFLQLNSRNDFLPFHNDATKKIEDVELPMIQNFDATTGAFLMIKSELFEEVNGFNEDYEKEAQDIDLCLKVRRIGYDIQVLNLVQVIHFENGTRVKGEESNFDRSLFVRLWSSFIHGILLN